MKELDKRLKFSPDDGKGLIEQSSRGITVKSELLRRGKSVAVSIENLSLNETNWIRFQALPTEVRESYLSRVIDDAMVEIMYKNPEMLDHYISAYRGVKQKTSPQ